MGRKRKISIYICGMVIDTSVFEDSVIEKNINERYEKWLGKGNVKFSIHRNEDGNEFTLTFIRDWGRQLTTYDDALFAGDWQIWFGDLYQDNHCPDCKLSDVIEGKRMLFYDDIPGILFMYKQKEKSLGATKLKGIEIIRNDKEQYVIKLKY